MKTFGERLKTARLFAGLTQEQLGLLAECGQALVSRIERGDQDSTSYVVKLAQACGVRAEYLDSGELPMISTYTPALSDPKIAQLIRELDTLPPYVIDSLLGEVETMKRLLESKKGPDKPPGQGKK